MAKPSKKKSTAKKPEKKAAPSAKKATNKPKAEKLTAADFGPQIPGDRLLNLLKSDTRIRKEIDGEVGKLREKIGYEKEHHHLDTTAYAIVKRFYRMEAEKLAELWPKILYYMDSAGLNERIDSVQRLPLEDESESGEHEEVADEPKTKAGPKIVDVPAADMESATIQ